MRTGDESAVGRVLALAVDRLADAVLVGDADERVVFANPAAGQVLGREPAALVGRPLGDLLADWPAAGDVDLRAIMAREPSATAVTHLRRPDGSLVPVEVQAARIPVDGGTRVCVIARDLSRRLQVETELRRSEELYRTTVDALEDWLHVVDDHLRVVFLNAAFRRVNQRLGLTVEAAGRELTEVYPFLPPERLDEYRRVLADGCSLTTEETSTVAGQTFVTETKKVPVFEGERVARVVTLIRDVTALRQAEAARLKSEQRLRTVFEVATDCIFIKDRQGSFTHVNPAMERRCGLPAHQILGRTDEDVFGPEAGGANAESDAAVLAGQEVSLEHTMIVQGVERTFHTIKVPLRDESGAIVGLCGFSRDLTARREAEERRRLLEARVQRIQRAESLGVLAGGVAHDFNNLLTTILGNAELLLRGVGEAEPARRQLTKVASAARRAAELTQQMLAYAGRGPLTLERVDLSTVAADMVRTLPVALTRNLRVETRLAPALPPVEGDPAQLRQAILACLLNAAEAMGPDGGTLTVATGVADVDRAYLSTCVPGDERPAGRYVWIEVGDTGCGIPPEDLERMFDPFFSTKFTGRGLGLAALLGIVQACRGAVHVTSAVDRGTTFRILLPAHEEA